MIGLAIFAVASGLGGLATNEGLLLAARGLQGLGAALASPAALALITTTFPAGPARNRAFAVYAAMSGAGAAVGLLLGGWLTGLDGIAGLDIDGWRLTLLINVPIGLAAAALSPRFLRESEGHDGILDLPGAVLGTLGLLGLVYGFSRAGSDGWTDTWTLSSLAAGVVLLVVFVLVERRAKHPLLPFRVFTNRTRAASFAGDVPGPGRDVRDVLLPQPVHPERHGLQPDQGRRRVPAVLRGHRGRPLASAPAWPAGSTRATWPGSAP